MTLTIRDEARREIQKDVDALTQHSRYFIMKAERAKTYFPIIEKIFAEEGVPDDFKFLVLQESALVADAVSVSNAVGFWQFLDFTAMEMGLRVDKEVDERMNLVSATHAAAKYLKQNNYRFNNWLLALQSYQMGAGGVIRAMGDSQNGAKHMEITSDTYWYVKKYLAHKVAFENSLVGEAQLKVIAYQPGKRMTLKEIAEELSAEEEVLREYNKWLKSSEIPEDRKYTVFIPVGKRDMDFTKLILASEVASKPTPLAGGNNKEPIAINSIPVVVAKAGENVATLAKRGGVDLSAFLKYNDVLIDHAVQAGDIYFLSRKKMKGEQEYYKTRPGDDLWSVSQQFGVRIKNLKKYNRIKEDQTLALGTMIWLQTGKPKSQTILPPAENVATLAEETFDWYTKSPKETILIKVPVPSQVIPGKPDVDSSFQKPVGAVKADLWVRPTEYVVKQGDTFYSIARLYGIEVTDLLAWNDLTIQNGLKPAQVLKVVENEPFKREATNGETMPDQLTVHEVKPTDTLYSIARQYGVTIKDIMEWNHKKDFSLSLGEKLEIRRRYRPVFCHF